ncbi:MAG: DUF4166 domain-containing protein [Thiohalomonadales bacterium]
MNKTDPIFKQILKADWDNLGKVIQDHYYLKPYSNDYICVTGEMDEIYHSSIAKLLIPFALIFGAIVPFNDSNVPIEVHYNSNLDNSKLMWDRVFKFKTHKAFHFKSYMEQQSGNEVIEYVRFGVGMKLAVSVQNGAIIFHDKGYVWKIMGIKIPLPINLLFGHAYIEERPIDETHFSMKMIIKHPLFGILFRYSGQFTFIQNK